MFISGSPPKKPIINLDLEGLILKMYFKKFMAKSVFMFLWFVFLFYITPLKSNKSNVNCNDQ